MRVPITARQVKDKTYYVFFALGGKYSGCYTTIKARNYEAARTEAARQYGLQHLGSVMNNEEQASGKINAFGLVKI